MSDTIDQAVAALDAIWKRNAPRMLEGDVAAARACQKVALAHGQLLCLVDDGRAR